MSTTRRFPIAAAVLVIAAFTASADPPSADAARAAMRRSTDFMFNTLANKGGFVWLYTMDLIPYGELKARPSMIWVEPPSTSSVGLVLIEAYRATGDSYYLDQARKVADALALGQNPAGGWNYFIDFDPAGTQAYYDSFFSKCWGWQEYNRKHDNCTFDDYVTSEATQFILLLYNVTYDAVHKKVLDKALDFILQAQYPNGAWPQRFPFEKDHPDYSIDYTFNDDVIYNLILVLTEAHEKLGDPRFETAARKGMDFYILSQLPKPQAGWAQQYDMDLKPAWGRTFEIGTLCTSETHTNILDLFRFYKMTGDKKYLAPIPAALDWLDSARVPGAKGYTHTCFNELGTNRPVYIKQTGTTVDDVKFELTYEEKGCYPYDAEITIPVEWLRTEYKRVSDLTPDQAHEELRKEESGPLPHVIHGYYLALALQKTKQTPEGIAEIISSIDERGGWRDDIGLLDPFEPFTKPKKQITAYTVGGYIGRMYRLVNYLDSLKAAKP